MAAAMRVVLDTNVLVSGLAYPNSVPGRIVQAWRQGALDVALSHFILDELARVLPRLTKAKLGATEVRDLIDTLMFEVDLVEPGETTDETLRDPQDQPVLATLLAARAAYLITGDKDLLALADRYSIVTPAQFWSRHGG